MATFKRYDFVIKDLMVSIAGGSHGGTWLPGPDDETPPSPISPVASVLVNVGLIDAVRSAVLEAVKAGQLEGIAQAFDAQSAGGNAVVRSAIHEIGTAVVASAAYSALGGSSKDMLPNPECGGTSYETIPPTLTPVVHKGVQVHRVAELPRLRAQLAETIAYVDRAAEARAPQRKEQARVRDQLKQALESLG